MSPRKLSRDSAFLGSRKRVRSLQPSHSPTASKHRKQSSHASTMNTCPIPHVADALEPYVRPRAEATAIRQNLHSYLERHLRLEDNQALSAINVSNPALTGNLQEPPNAFSGVRKAYWRALRAHQAAQARYEDLKADLQQLTEETGHAAPDAHAGTFGADLLPLVRQREKRRKLQVLDRAFSGIEDEGSGAIGAGVDDLVRQKVGEAPVPPSAQPLFTVNGAGGGKALAEDRILELKKAVLSAQREADADGNSIANGVAGGREGPGEVHALQQARNELIGWIERQLALIGEAQAGEAGATTSGDSHERAVSSEDISRLYDGYLDARERLLHVIQSPANQTPLPLVDPSPRATQAATSTDADVAAAQATTLLPFIVPLLSAKNEEQSQLQQAAYIRRQLKAAEADSDRLMRRLADESHLVHPGASKGKDWYDAANDAGKTTEDFVRKKVEGGEKATKEAERTVQDIGDVPTSLEKLL